LQVTIEAASQYFSIRAGLTYFIKMGRAANLSSPKKTFVTNELKNPNSEYNTDTVLQFFIVTDAM